MRSQLSKNTLRSLAAVAALFLLLWWSERAISDYYVLILQLWGIYVILGVTLQLIFGFTGQFSLAHAGLIAVGAYTTAVLTLSPEAKQLMFLLEPPAPFIRNLQWPLLPTLLMSAFLAGVVGFLVAAPALRVRGDYLTIVTLGFSEIIRLALCNLPSICNAAMGLRGIPKQANLLWTWGIALLTIFVTKRLVDSNYGRALKAISEDEIAAEALGVNLFHYKLLAFVVSSFFVGFAGSILAQVLGTIDPATFRLTLTYAALTIVVLGGIRSITGTVIAAGIYTISSEWLRTVESPRKILGIQIPGVPGMRVIFFAVLLLLLILYRRTGLLGEREFSWDGLSAWLRSLLPRRRRTEVES